jgi:hypothetical protein
LKNRVLKLTPREIARQEFLITLFRAGYVVRRSLFSIGSVGNQGETVSLTDVFVWLIPGIDPDYLPQVPWTEVIDEYRVTVRNNVTASIPPVAFQSVGNSLQIGVRLVLLKLIQRRYRLIQFDPIAAACANLGDAPTRLRVAYRSSIDSNPCDDRSGWLRCERQSKRCNFLNSNGIGRNI